MKPFTLKRFVLLPLIIISLILTTGCHLISHYCVVVVVVFFLLVFKLEATRIFKPPPLFEFFGFLTTFFQKMLLSRRRQFLNP